MKKVSVYKTEGIILKVADLGELNRLLTIYTFGYGKILARAVSARKKESKLKGLITPFTRANFLLAKSKTIDILIDIEILDSYQCLHNNLKNLGCTFYFSELANKLIFGAERDENLWRLISRAFEVLNQPQPNLDKIKLAFEDKLLEFLGYAEPAAKNKLSATQKLDYMQSLAGGQINSYKFLAQI